MRWLKFIKTHKTTVRVVYWASFTVFMLLIGLPLFFFFYLFDEDHTKHMIIEQFDQQKYKIELEGQVVPKLWHGLSLELGGVIINSQDNKNLIEFNNVSFQLSWLNLLIGKYKINRFAVNGVDINEANVLHGGLANLLNLSNNQNNAFADIESVDIYNIKTVGRDMAYPVSNGSLKFERSGGSATFKVGLRWVNTNTFITTEGTLTDVSNGVLHFTDFMIKSYDKQVVLSTLATASYDLKAQKFIINDLSGKISLNGYAGGLKISQIGLSANGGEITQLNAYLDSNGDFINQHLSIATDKLLLRGFKQLLVGQLNTEYIVSGDNSKLVLDSITRDFAMEEDMQQIKSNNCVNKIKYTSSRFAGTNGLLADLDGVCSYNFRTMIADLNLVGTFNKVPAKLALQVSNQNEKPYIKADGVIDDLDFSRFKLQTEKLLPIYMDNSALPFAWLSLINMDANLKVKSFALDRISLNNLVTKLNIANGQLNIYKISANVYGGNLSGSAKITKQGGMLKRKDNKNIIVDAIGGGGNSYNISTKQDIYNLNLQKMLEDLFSVTAISGVANLALDINANNVQSYEDLHKKLNGQIVVDAKKGAFNGVDFNLFANPAKIGIPTAPKSTIFDHLAAKFNFVDGVSRYGNLTFSSPYVVANGSGMIDFVNTTLNYKLNIKSVLPSNEQKIGSVVIPVMVSGSLFNPKINIQNMHLSAKQVIIPFNKSGKTNKINKVHNKKVSPQHKGVSK